MRGRVSGSCDQAAGRIRIIQVEPDNGEPDFRPHRAGQYALLRVGAEEPYRPYSIASLPEDKKLEFHIRTGGVFAEGLRIGTPIEISGYEGTASYQDDCPLPLVLVAGGTGLAGLLSVARAALYDRADRPVTLYHGVREESDLYVRDLLADLMDEYETFTYTPLIGTMPDRSIFDPLADRNGYRFHFAGPAPMMELLAALAKDHGVPDNLVHSDLDFFAAQDLKDSTKART